MFRRQGQRQTKIYKPSEVLLTDYLLLLFQLLIYLFCHMLTLLSLQERSWQVYQLLLSPLFCPQLLEIFISPFESLPPIFYLLGDLCYLELLVSFFCPIVHQNSLIFIFRALKKRLHMWKISSVSRLVFVLIRVSVSVYTVLTCLNK